MAKAKKKSEPEIPNHIMADLCSRFVINSDGNEQHPIRIFYITEHAYWHYIDFYCNEQAELPKCNHKALTKCIFLYLPSLGHFLQDFETMYQEWTVHKRNIPSYGGILLSPDFKHVLLVQGYTSKTSWGFPKGKVETAESCIECAVREVYEETGIDVEKQIQEADYIDHWFYEQYSRLYIIPGIQTDSTMQPKLRKEIREYRWMPVDALPSHKNDPITKQLIGIESSNFFKVIPFVSKLRKWIVKAKEEYKTTLPASQFTAKGRRGKGKEGQRRQNHPGPHGDASSSREGQTRRGQQGSGLLARSLSEQFSDVLTNQGGQQSKQTRSGGPMTGGGSRRDQYQESETKSGKSKTKVSEKHATIGKLRLDEFHSKSMLNFRFNVEAILDCLKW